MGVVVYSSGAVVGHQSLITNGAYTSYTMTRTSGALPAAGYRIVSAVLTCTLRNAQWDTITAKSGSVTLGSFDAAATSGERTCALSSTFGWANFTALTLYGGGQGTQITGGSYVTVTVTWEYTTSSLTLSAASVQAGSSVTATIGYHDAAFTHQLALTFGTRTSTWTIAAGNSGYTFTVPISWLDQIPTARSGAATVTLRTLSGGNVIGSSARPLTVTAPASAAPTFEASVLPLLTVGGMTYPSMGVGVFVQAKSGYSAAISGAAALYGATVAGYSIRGGGYAGTAAALESGLLYAAGDVAIVFRVTDSRGMYAEQTITINVLPYSPPVVSSFVGWRVDDTGSADVKGVLGKCKAVWSCSALGGANTCTAQAYLHLKSASEETELAAAMMSGETYAVAGSSGNVQLALTAVYVLRLVLTDAFGSVAFTAEIPSAKFALHFSSDGTSVALGAACQRQNAVEVADGKAFFVHGMELLDLLYPVGSIYLSVSDVSPASIYGGTWEQITDRFLLAAGSAYTAGTTGGEAMHTLTTEELASHGHASPGSDGRFVTMPNSAAANTADARFVSASSGGTLIRWSPNWLTANAGGGGAHNNMPPYLAVYIWQRIA